MREMGSKTAFLLLILGFLFSANLEVNSSSTVLGLKDVYSPGEKLTVITDFRPEKALIVSPAKEVFELNFSEREGLYYSEFEFRENVVLGEYRLIMDGIEKSFIVDHCNLSTEYADGTLRISAKTFFTQPRISFTLDSEQGEANGEVILQLSPGEHEIAASCLNSEIRKKIAVNFTISYNGSVFAELDGKFVSSRLKVISDREYEFEGLFNPGMLNLTRFRVEAEYAHLKASRDFDFSLDLKDVYFPGETVTIRGDFTSCRMINPLGEEEEIKLDNGLAAVELNKNVVLGKYRLILDGFEKEFFVDSYSINASLSENRIEGNVTYYFLGPEEVAYRINGQEGKAKVENGTFRIPLNLSEGKYTAILRAGNAELSLDFEIRSEKTISCERLYFIGEKVEIRTNFAPEESYLIFGDEKIPIEFSERNGSWIYDFLAEKVGKYRVIADGIEREFLIDSCSLEAWSEDSKVYGRASANFTDAEVQFSILPSNSSGSITPKNGTFEMDLPEGAEEVILVCKNSEMKLKPGPMVSDFRRVDFDGQTFNFSLSKGKFRELNFDGENASLVISEIGAGEKVEVKIELPFEIPDGAHAYYWKEVNGSFIPVNYTVGENGRQVTLTLQDGVVDEDGEANGVIVDPIKLYIPKFSVEKELEAHEGKLKVKGDRDFEIGVETNKELSYLAFVDPENLPSRPAEFPYGLIKFRIEVERGGEAEIKILYPSLEGLLDDEGNATFFKFNPKTLEWSSFKAKVEGSYVVLHLKDGGFGDEDGEEDGVISDDGGVGWVGFIGTYGASICRESKTNEVHVYWLYVPSGQNFTVNIYDGDGLQARVYYPNGSLQGTYNANSGDNWDSFTIQTASSFGWWRIELFEDSWSSNNGNYYGINVTGADEINLRVNSSYSVSGQNLYGTNDSVIVGDLNENLNPYQNYYVFADSFNFSVYDPDGNNQNPRINLTVTSPTGSVQGWNLSGNNVWTAVQTVSGDYGVWRINVSQRSNHDDYNAGGNHYRLAVNLSEGLYFKPPVVFNIKGTVLHDLFPLGRNNGEDRPISGVEVLLVEDMNGNRIPDSGDRVLRKNVTDSNGNFSFRAVKDITRTYFVVVNSRTINAANASLSYNSGYSIGHVWAEQTFQTNDSSYSQLVPFFGGRGELSDNVSYVGTSLTGRAEHFITINCSSYNNETLYFGFNFSVVTNTRDADDDTANPRSCQGCFRQFVLNSNAISGKQRSYFVMGVPANAYDSNGSWWFIPLNASLGSLDISDPVEINGTSLRADMSVIESNPGYVIYDYGMKDLKSVNSRESIPVGVGPDGVLFSGDEAMLYAIPKPELEIYGANLNPALNLTFSASNSEIRNISIFGSNYNQYPGVLRSYAGNLKIENVFAGLRANGTDPKASGLNRTGGANLWIEGNNTTVLNSIVAFAERYGLLFYSSSIKAGRAENVIAFRNALTFDGGDNVGVESSASNVTIERSVSAKAAAQGIETYNSGGGVRIFNCSVEANAFGNETGYVSETAGIRINANNSFVAYSLIRNNFGHGVTVVRYGSDVLNVTITRNSIYNNSKLGIDLVNAASTQVAHLGDNVTLNDGVLNCSMANCGVDYPILTLAELDGDELYLEGFIGKEGAAGNQLFANSVVEVYLVRNSTDGDDLKGNNWSSSELPRYYGEGWIYLGGLTANSSGYFSGSISVSGKGVDENSQITALTILNGNSSEFGPNARVSKKLNVSAEISLYGVNATIKVKAHEKARNLKVYWIKPEGISVAFSGNYNSYGSDGVVFWWEFSSIEGGEERFVNLSFNPAGAFSLSEALRIGLDP